MNQICTNCGMQIKVAIFLNSGYCSDKCRKELGYDVSSVGTYMFVSVDEKRMLKEARDGR